MAHTTREEKDDSAHFRRALLPTLAETIALLSGSLLFLIALNLIPAVRFFNDVNYSMVTDYVRETVEKVLAPTDNQGTSRILTVVLWMVVGMIAYIIVWFVGSMIANYRRDITETRGMTLPANFNRDDAWHETILRIIIRVLTSIALLYWIYLLLAAILPYASSLFLANITDFGISSLAALVLSVLILAGSIFVAMIFARCMVLRERVFSG